MVGKLKLRVFVKNRKNYRKKLSRDDIVGRSGLRGLSLAPFGSDAREDPGIDLALPSPALFTSLPFSAF
jgi:hypothetical protein